MWISKQKWLATQAELSDLRSTLDIYTKSDIKGIRQSIEALALGRAEVLATLVNARQEIYAKLQELSESLVVNRISPDSSAALPPLATEELCNYRMSNLLVPENAALYCNNAKGHKGSHSYKHFITASTGAPANASPPSWAKPSYVVHEQAPAKKKNGRKHAPKK